jgi:hypothetical protein
MKCQRWPCWATISSMAGLTVGARGRPAATPDATGLYHVAILYPTRAEPAGADRRVLAAQVPLGGAADHGISEAIYLRTPTRTASTFIGTSGLRSNGRAPPLAVWRSSPIRSTRYSKQRRETPPANRRHPFRLSSGTSSWRVWMWCVAAGERGTPGRRVCMVGMPIRTPAAISES